MKFCSGKTLTEFIKNNKMYCSTNVLLDYTLQLASGLRYLHENMEFIHGCLASTGILTKDFTGKKLKIANLDCAIQRKSARLSEEQMKNFNNSTFSFDNSSFMSPEMMPWLPYGDERNRRPLSSSTDIWSLGCVVLDMYLVREGQPGLRFDIDKFPDEIAQGHVREGFPLIPQIPEAMPEELKVLARHCLKVNPDDRLTTATLLNYPDCASLMLKTFDLQEITGTTTVDEGNRSSEWCSGITLKDFIKRNASHCSTERIVKYTTQVASGLNYLHEGIDRTKFVHGDITSSNIMMESTGENVKIIDIEGAFQYQRGLMPSKKKFSLGKESYYFTSPEMAVWLYPSRNVIRPPPDSPTDIYSLGCVVMDMYFASQGQALWPDHDYESIRSAMESEHPLTPRMPENLPVELKDLARQCLQVNPSDRPTGVELVIHCQLYLKEFTQMSDAVDQAPIPLNSQAMVQDGDRNSGTVICTFKDCFGDLEFELRRIPTDSIHCLEGRGFFGYIKMVDAFYLDDGNPVAEHAGNQAYRLLLEPVEHARSEELRSLLKLKHSNILQYILIGYASNPNTQGSHYCLLMECCSGITLRNFITSNPKLCSTERIVKYTTQLASGLNYLHEGIKGTKFIHGDITSSNIMMESTGENVKIIDIEGAFQQPRGLRSSKKEFNVKGSFYFMSPEMAVWHDYNRKVVRPTPDSPTDIYSLGCVIMDMCFASQGQALWPDHDDSSIRSAMQSEHPLTPRVPENLPDELKVPARRCLQVSPSDRPTAATLESYFSRMLKNPHFKCPEHGILWYIPSSKKPLGQPGGFGVVHRVDAFWVGADFVEQGPLHLALKTFSKPLEQDEVEKIEKTLLKLNHPNIVKYLAAGLFEDDRQFRIIMECCSGGTLTEAAKTVLPIEMQKNYVKQLIQGIQYLHEEENIIHKDLKGTNVVFGDETKSTLKICDVDSYSDRHTVDSVFFISRPLGTEGFASPEMLASLRNSIDAKGNYPVGRATDIWSLGAVVLEMYCKGKLIMPEDIKLDNNPRTILVADALSMKIPVIPEDMQQELKDLVSKCMALKPKDRPTIKQLRDDFPEG
ncbi:putative Mitogen-activated protein kinase kinase kinase 1 [Hypsibius exemplaris]|uniref:non-specific serine/threonine protein kinase n=1 Tax=Hypsibius exemplaris TaxID=2072580 RepID=A0A9X6RMP8_HYPEX|nr:putative Mitogen-activated protein kinase kinase kinase 1 [Hypsibius exemplaris]